MANIVDEGVSKDIFSKVGYKLIQAQRKNFSSSYVIKKISKIDYFLIWKALDEYYYEIGDVYIVFTHDNSFMNIYFVLITEKNRFLWVGMSASMEDWRRPYGK